MRAAFPYDVTTLTPKHEPVAGLSSVLMVRYSDIRSFVMFPYREIAGKSLQFTISRFSRGTNLAIFDCCDVSLILGVLGHRPVFSIREEKMNPITCWSISADVGISYFPVNYVLQFLTLKVNRMD